MVSRLLPQRNLAAVFSICLLTLFFLHTQGYGQTVGGDEEVTPVGETPPPSDPNPTEDPQVVPDGEEPEAPEPTNEDLVCGTLSDGLPVSCPNKTPRSCAGTGKCQHPPNEAGQRTCIQKHSSVLLHELVVSHKGSLGLVPLEVKTGVTQVFAKSVQVCFQTFACGAFCEINKKMRHECVRGTPAAPPNTRYKYTEDTTKACVNNNVISVEPEPNTPPIVPSPEPETETQN